MDMSYKTTRIKYEYLENADILNRKQQATKFLEEDVDRAIYITPSLVAGIFSFCGYVYIIGQLNILIIITILLVIAFNTLVQNNVEKYAFSYRSELAPVERRIAYFIMNVPNQKYGKEIRLYNLSGWLHKKYKDELHRSDAAYKKVFDKRTRGGMLTTFANSVQTVCIYSWLILMALKGAITVGAFTMYFNAISNFSQSVLVIFSNWIRLSNIKKGMDDYFVFMEMEEEKEGSQKEKDTSSFIASKMFPCIEFRNVSFRYPNGEQYALKNVNVTINYGQKVSIVGENGAGKTTFIKLLTRLYEPTDGMILVNGTDIRDIDIEEYRKLYSVVFQDYNIFPFQISENIVLADDEKQDASKQVLETLQSVGLNEKVNTLDNGTETYIDTIFSPDGIQLSGGQSQKLAIARAMYRNSPILVLDEPTAALDPRAEYEIYKNFHNISKDKTTFFVSHRMSSSRFCNLVLVFQDGEICESGSHHELLEKKGLYYELYIMQAQFYEDISEDKFEKENFI